jgi:hypothetical protein
MVVALHGHVLSQLTLCLHHALVLPDPLCTTTRYNLTGEQRARHVSLKCCALAMCSVAVLGEVGCITAV